MISFDAKKNITFYDYLYSNIAFILLPLKDIITFRKIYKNYIQVIKQRRENKFPIDATLKNGKKVTLQNLYQYRMYTWKAENYCNFKNEFLIINKPNLPEIKLIGWEENGDLGAIFFDNDYNSLPVKGNTVVDIGANIADSSIYFALNGAKKIYALEPSPMNYKIAEKNIQLNNLSNKIDLVLAGCSSKNGFVQMSSKDNGILYSLENKDDGDVKIPLITLQEIIERSNNDSVVLKIDCEGCEYEIINFSSPEILKKFSHIIIEYHYGYLNIKNKLENCGFKVTVSKPKIGKRLTSKKLKTYVGYLFAERIND